MGVINYKTNLFICGPIYVITCGLVKYRYDAFVEGSTVEKCPHETLRMDEQNLVGYIIVNFAFACLLTFYSYLV
jgi:hypothetical protein